MRSEIGYIPDHWSPESTSMKEMSCQVSHVEGGEGEETRRGNRKMGERLHGRFLSDLTTHEYRNIASVIADNLDLAGVVVRAQSTSSTRPLRCPVLCICFILLYYLVSTAVKVEVNDLEVRVRSLKLEG